MQMEYEERVVAFIDVLGWGAAVENSASDPQLRDRMENAVSSLGLIVRDYVDEKDDPRILESLPASDDQATQFSDSVVISFRSNAPWDLTRMVNVVCSYQVTMIMSGFPIRGGITVGKMHHSGSVSFGPALNRAVCLEKLARYPRVIVDQFLNHQVRAAASKLPRHWNFVFEDDDGWIIPDYLGAIAISPASNRQVRQIIESAKARSNADTGILAKYDWLSAKLDNAIADSEWRHQIFEENRRIMAASSNRERANFEP
jgi:hypothetical protein